MAFANEYILNVDLKKTISNNVPTFKQGDTAILKFKIFDNGKAYDLSSFTDAEITFRIPSGDVVIGNPVLEDGMIVYRLHGAEMARVGNVSTILTIRSGDDEVSIQPFRIFIYDSMKTENLTYIGALQELIEATQEIEVNSYTIITEMNETRVALETDANTYKETLVQDVTEYKSEVNTFNSNRVHKKNWNAATQYVTNNEVEFNGSTWRALRNNKGVTPVEGLDWTLIARKGDDGLGTVNRIREVFIATEGQRDFNLQQTYDQYQNRIDVTVMGVPQFSPDNFTELTNKSIRLSEGVPAGTEVIVVYYTQSIPMASDIQTTVNNHTNKLNNHEVRVSETETNVTSITAQLAEIVTVAKQQGSDDTVNLQSAINNAITTVFLEPNKTYNVNELTLKSNIIIDGRGATLFLHGGQTALKSVLKVTQCKDITIRNLTIDGNRVSNGSNTGSQDGGNHGIAIISSSNIRLENIVVKDCGTDGIYIGETSGGSTPSADIELRNVVSTNNSRQGISIIHCQNFRAFRCKFNGSNGKAPQAGVDIEPNVAANNRNIVFEKCEMSNNSGRGFVLQNRGTCEDVSIIGCLITNNLMGMRVTGSGDIRRLIFRDNIITANDKENWFGIGETLVCSEFIISNNVSDSRFKIQGVSNVKFNDNRINLSDNTITALVLISGSYFEIRNNRIVGGSHGVETFDNRSTNLDVSLNNIDVTGRGIFIKSSGNKILSNRVVTTAIYAIEITASKNIATGNILTAATNGVRLSSTATDNIVNENIMNLDISNGGGATNLLLNNKVVA